MPTRILTTATLEGLLDEAGLRPAAAHVRPLDGRAAPVAVDDGRWIYPASMIKLAVAVALQLALAAGRIEQARPVAVDPANLTVNDKPSPLVAGYAARVDELEELMLTRSDNVATNMLIDVLGRERASADLERFALRDTAIRRKLSGALPLIDDPAATGRNSLPAADAATLFERIARDELPGAAHLRNVLARQEWNEKLAAGLEPGDRFAHKTGDTDEVCHDGGILTTVAQQTSVVVVYTELPSTGANDERFAAFMRALRPHL